MYPKKGVFLLAFVTKICAKELVEFNLCRYFVRACGYYCCICSSTKCSRGYAKGTGGVLGGGGWLVGEKVAKPRGKAEGGKWAQQSKLLINRYTNALTARARERARA